MKARFIPFQVEHLDQFTALDIYEKHPYKDIYRDVAGMANVNLFTLLDDTTGLPIAVMGFITTFPSVANVWCVTGKAATEKPLYFTKACKRLIDVCMKNYKVKRAEVYIRCDQSWALKWGQALGFKLEGICKNYGFEVKDHYLMARYS